MTWTFLFPQKTRTIDPSKKQTKNDFTNKCLGILILSLEEALIFQNKKEKKFIKCLLVFP